MEQFSTEQVAQQLSMTSRGVRQIVERHPELAPRKVGKAWVWTLQDIERVRKHIGKGRKTKSNDSPAK